MTNRLSKELDDYLTAVLAAIRDADDDATAAELARAELPHLVGTVRTLLSHHRSDGRTRCPACRSRSWRGFRRSNMPCRAYLSAHQRLLVLGGTEV